MTSNFISSKYNNNIKISINKSHNRIRSFVSRQRKLTQHQLNAIKNNWAEMVIEFTPKLINFSKLFRSDKPVIMDIGFGNGKSLISMAQHNSHQNFLGVEVYLPGIANCLIEAKKVQIKNLRLVYYDVHDVLEKMIPDHSLNKIQLFFPDPWPKICHHKRRIINTSFTNLVGQKLNKYDSLFHILTDCKNYASYIMQIVNNTSNSKSQFIRQSNTIISNFSRPVTKFEQRGNLLGNKIHELIFKKIN
ncbi:tRNA (guanosine(46)-N7)-methyltransferase TrmB [Pantoea sp. SoEX]|uniref:tRNA (guanosine(46)-N7)-methyltransferase TrmB n=1 Tax=Pantoea sp. SoEX TaxID=2576763 RepID=UPI001359881E|nr:tRNA (guanosine(46)-N7)-methyltransferase TrmB [Pantoea sp. SoEX]MXP51306.1 tRNA (guanosine(46)-N7)-methyltransferase TrmB [Pantoea sp. SoEX]